MDTSDQDAHPSPQEPPPPEQPSEPEWEWLWPAYPSDLEGRDAEPEAQAPEASDEVAEPPEGEAPAEEPREPLEPAPAAAGEPVVEDELVVEGGPGAEPESDVEAEPAGGPAAEAEPEPEPAAGDPDVEVEPAAGTLAEGELVAESGPAAEAEPEPAAEGGVAEDGVSEDAVAAEEPSELVESAAGREPVAEEPDGRPEPAAVGGSVAEGEPAVGAELTAEAEPVVEEPEAEAEAEVEPESTEAEPESVAEAEPVTEVEPVVEGQPGTEPVAEERVAEEPEAEPEPTALAEGEPVAGAGSVAEESEAEPEPVDQAEPVVEGQPEAEAEPAADVEPGAQAEKAAEEAGVGESEPEPEPEPDEPETAVSERSGPPALVVRLESPVSEEVVEDAPPAVPEWTEVLEWTQAAPPEAPTAPEASPAPEAPLPPEAPPPPALLAPPEPPLPPEAPAPPEATPAPAAPAPPEEPAPPAPETPAPTAAPEASAPPAPAAPDWTEPPWWLEPPPEPPAVPTAVAPEWAEPLDTAWPEPVTDLAPGDRGPEPNGPGVTQAPLRERPLWGPAPPPALPPPTSTAGPAEGWGATGGWDATEAWRTVEGRGATQGWGAAEGWGVPAGRPTRRRRRGWILALALLVAGALAVTGLTGRWADLVGRGTSAGTGTGSTGRPSAGAQRGGANGQIDPGPAVRQLLAKRATAVLRHDRAGFLATVDRRRTSFYRGQAALFDHMASVPFSNLAYELGAAGRDLATERVRRHYAPSPVYLPEVEASYRFRGQDSAPVTSQYYYTFALTSAGWRIAGQGDLTAPRQDDVEIWDSSAVRSLASKRTLVVYHSGQRALAQRLLAAAERGYTQVDQAWSSPWEHKVVILVPNDQGEAQRLVHGRDLSDVAAVSASQVEAGSDHRVLGNRVIVNTKVLSRYNTLNLQIVITHEMTHVATRAVGVGVPLFLVEGLADYAALRPVSAPLRITRPVLAAAVRDRHFKGALPSEDDLLGRDGALAYDEASSFCLWVVRSFGQPKLQSLYRSFADVEVPTPALLDQRMRQVLGISFATAQSRWASFVRQAL